MSDELNVLRVVRSRPYMTHIDAAPLRDERLSLAAKGLYAVMYTMEEVDYSSNPFGTATPEEIRAAGDELIRFGYAGEVEP